MSSTSTSTQNIYDDPSFFTAYGTLPRSEHGLAGAPEWPVLRDMIIHEKKTADVQGQNVLDLGCGYGWFARWAVENGAARVKGIDVSMKMMERAKKIDGSHGLEGSVDIEYEICDLETFTVAGDDQGRYDLVYSSLTFHYIADLGRLFREIRACLKTSSEGEKGRFFFSVEHPICTAPISPAPGWVLFRNESKAERRVWPLNNYSEEGLRLTSWLGTEGVQKYHHTVETYVSSLLANGFVLTGLRDWVPSWEDVRDHPEWREERHRPYFLLVSAEAP